jgi:PTS system galactitol-specific IIC component
MKELNSAVMYLLGFKTYVFLPIIIFALCMLFRIRIGTAIRSSLSIGIGFLGIFMVFDRFVAIIRPVVEALISRTGLSLNVLDVGWPPLAAITWSFRLAPVLVGLFMAVNVAMLLLRLTKSMDIDIWNYWHVIFAAALVNEATGNPWISVGAGLLCFVMVLKLSDWISPAVNRLSGMQGVCIPHLSGIIHYPLALAGDRLIGMVPGLRRLELRSDTIQKKLGLAGEPMMIGLLLGALMSLGAGYGFKGVAETAVGFAAVIFILPKMSGILGASLIPVSEGMKEFISKRFPRIGGAYIGLDVAVLFGLPSVVVTTLLLTPVAILLAFVLPGINFIPLGDLTNILVPVSFVAVACRGNIARAFLVGVPILVMNLYAASGMAGFLTAMARNANYEVAGYRGTFTSFLDGGNPFRFWVVKLASGEMLGYLLIPAVAFLLAFTWWESKRENAAMAAGQSQAGS